MYESYFNLTENPFKLAPDPNYYFGSRGHNRVLAYLQYGVQQGDGFVVVTGDIGTGKTTLVKTLLLEVEKQKDIIAAQINTTQLDPENLLGMILESFGISSNKASKPTMLKKLETFLKTKNREGKRVLLILDEAQNLPVSSLEELRMLSNYQIGQNQLFQSFLVGQCEFRDVLKNDNLEQLRQRVIASYHLGPLNSEETKAYIEYRLGLAGWKNDPKFNKSAIDSIYHFSRGIPRRINLLCNRILLYSCMSELHTITDKMVKTVTRELDEEVIGLTGSDEIKSLDHKKNINSGYGNASLIDEKLLGKMKNIRNFLSDFEKLIEKYTG